MYKGGKIAKVPVDEKEALASSNSFFFRLIALSEVCFKQTLDILPGNVAFSFIGWRTKL